MTLSIIIVNYNSGILLEQCLLSVTRANATIRTEIIVVDNASSDRSKDSLPPAFPGVRFIFNSENLGFSKACNQGYRVSAGKYILFLNPDTILSENSLVDCLDFFGSHPEAGAIGVRMIDSRGNFLKESKRGFPSPAASFYKLFGFAAIFPSSALFAKYYQGHLPEKENNEIEILSGAFMMIRREVFEKLNGFDERFFMYGEDIDLSVRIRQAGYKNYYLGRVTVIHIKGGSTLYNKQYVQDFYDAMRLFVQKYYEGRPIYASFLITGIQLRKAIASIRLLLR